jgi:Mg2+ and Co2+ transporter CorA
VEIHQKLTIVGVILLVATFLINYYHQETHPDVGFNYAYVTGVLMLVAFSISFVLFTKNQLKIS